jgi:hypothetical protein
VASLQENLEIEDRMSSCERLYLSGDIPDKASEISGDGHGDFVSGQPSSHGQVSEAFGQSQLCAPGDVAYDFRLTLLAHLRTWLTRALCR